MRRAWRLPGEAKAITATIAALPQELISCVKRAFLYQGNDTNGKANREERSSRASLRKASCFLLRITIRLPINYGEIDCIKRPVRACLAP